ncbi:hypothetical protein DJ91_5723 [Priestia megaterium]|nr:hypothetical protein DJ91_5723 [Priestia megaterium]
MSYNLGDKAQKFLPSYRKWLDYEKVIHVCVKIFCFFGSYISLLVDLMPLRA